MWAQLPVAVLFSARSDSSVRHAAYEASKGEEVWEELRRRGVLEGRPRWPAGEYAAYLLESHLGGHRVGTKGSHQVVSHGERVQVHGRHVHGREPLWFATTFNPEERDFDVYVPVLFDEDYSVRGAWRIPWDAFQSYARLYPRTGWRLPVTGPWREDPAVESIELADMST